MAPKLWLAGQSDDAVVVSACDLAVQRQLRPRVGASFLSCFDQVQADRSLGASRCGGRIPSQRLVRLEALGGPQELPTAQADHATACLAPLRPISRPRTAAMCSAFLSQQPAAGSQSAIVEEAEEVTVEASEYVHYAKETASRARHMARQSERLAAFAVVLLGVQIGGTLLTSLLSVRVAKRLTKQKIEELDEVDGSLLPPSDSD
eukprot:TRINITY_DN123426_c0_g1_i1.p1 TRINITY_DN123426_c0_g1~~TRINITY_DN123426_c0_g1_i1.p1  ORF type:complete len:205 (-),score=48.04 TRINITY_DN123426_c0_g1_i1:62-676(-)